MLKDLFEGYSLLDLVADVLFLAVMFAAVLFMPYLLVTLMAIF